jgi:uncharacterized membrane protein YdjX (TVP38/TMEM64 family)
MPQVVVGISEDAMPVKTKDFVLGTGLGTIPMTALTLFIGEAAIAWWNS